MTTAGSSLWFIVGLDCGHFVELTVVYPTIQSAQFCYSCDTWRRVSSYPDYYRARCMSVKGIKCLDRLRIDEKVLRRAIETHGRNHPDHTAELRRFNSENQSVVIAKHKGKTGWDNEPVSLADMAKLSQAILRNRAPASSTDSGGSQEPA